MRETIKVVFENYLKVCVFWTHAYACIYLIRTDEESNYIS